MPTDASRFGQAYLEKFGWDASKGLGASGEGRTNAIKASQKLDMLGIGMRHQKDVDGGIAWRQNRDFEDLLRRLNEGSETTDTTGPLPLSFHKAHESESLEGEAEKAASEGGKVQEEDGGDGQEGVTTKKEKRKKKKKRKATEDEEVEEEQDLDRKERKKKKRKKSLSSRDGGDDGHAIPSNIASEPPPLPSRPLPNETRPADKSACTPIATATATATDTATTMPAPVPVRAP
jgi:Pin2-interacting protein X1